MFVYTSSNVLTDLTSTYFCKPFFILRPAVFATEIRWAHCLQRHFGRISLFGNIHIVSMLLCPKTAINVVFCSHERFTLRQIFLSIFRCYRFTPRQTPHPHLHICLFQHVKDTWLCPWTQLSYRISHTWNLLLSTHDLQASDSSHHASSGHIVYVYTYELGFNWLWQTRFTTCGGVLRSIAKTACVSMAPVQRCGSTKCTHSHWWCIHPNVQIKLHTLLV